MTMTNNAPIQDVTRLFQIWSIKDVYTGPSGTGRYVPNPGDIVIQVVVTTKTEYLVQAVDPQTLLSTLVVLSDDTDGDFPSNTLFGAGPGPQSSTFVLYIDHSVTPARMAVDKRCWCGGSGTKYAKIFLGTDISSTGSVISAMFDTNGNFISENVPLELAG